MKKVQTGPQKNMGTIKKNCDTVLLAKQAGIPYKTIWRKTQKYTLSHRKQLF